MNIFIFLQHPCGFQPNQGKRILGKTKHVYKIFCVENYCMSIVYDSKYIETCFFYI